jgi:hypothetical protein
MPRDSRLSEDRKTALQRLRVAQLTQARSRIGGLDGELSFGKVDHRVGVGLETCFYKPRSEKARRYARQGDQQQGDQDVLDFTSPAGVHPRSARSIVFVAANPVCLAGSARCCACDATQRWPSRHRWRCNEH